MVLKVNQHHIPRKQQRFPKRRSSINVTEIYGQWGQVARPGSWLLVTYSSFALAQKRNNEPRDFLRNKLRKDSFSEKL